MGIPQQPQAFPSFAYGIPLFTTGQLRTLYGIVRPCPELVCLSPQLEFQHVVCVMSRKPGNWPR
ncbi:hypothetical protein [Streptomyces sp. NPDC005385]|uniref:hypothetical protein n=1 Tax=Streptomyces sp. NPDC005385 TaxID=3157039 RepID=UPI0033BD2032